MSMRKIFRERNISKPSMMGFSIVFVSRKILRAPFEKGLSRGQIVRIIVGGCVFRPQS